VEEAAEAEHNDAAAMEDGHLPTSTSRPPPHPALTLPPIRVSSQGLLPSTPICVDMFTSSASINRLQQVNPSMAQACDVTYILSHMHADHTAGLTPSWNLGTIYTSQISKTLLESKFGVSPSLVIGLPLYIPFLIPLNRSGAIMMRLTLLDASTHCPGAVLLLMEGYFGRILYTGDMRFDRRCEQQLRKYVAAKDEIERRVMKRAESEQGGYGCASVGMTVTGAAGDSERLIGLSIPALNRARRKRKPVPSALAPMAAPAQTSSSSVAASCSSAAVVPIVGEREGKEDRMDIEPRHTSSTIGGADSGFSWLLHDDNDDAIIGVRASDLKLADIDDEHDDLSATAISQLVDVTDPASSSGDGDGSQSGLLGCIDTLYLDNTFCHPRYAPFHSTSSALRELLSIVRAHGLGTCDVLLGGDTLGKEDLLVLLAHALKTKIVVPENRWRMLQGLARAGATLHTDMDEESVRRVVEGKGEFNVDGESEETNSSSSPATTSASSFISPLSSPSLWLSCFSPRPFDGFVKLAPKQHVTRANIEWMNQQLYANKRHRHNGARQTRRTKRRPRDRRRKEGANDVDANANANDNDNDNVAEKKCHIAKQSRHHTHDSAQAMDAASSRPHVHDVCVIESSASSDESDMSDESSNDDDVDDDVDDDEGVVGSNDMLCRPVIGITVSGWTVDKVRHAQPTSQVPAATANGVHVTAPPDSDSLSSHHPSLPSSSINCIGPGPGHCSIHFIAYSSHSSFSDLARFVSLLQPRCMRALVKGQTNPKYLDSFIRTDLTPPIPIVIPDMMMRPASTLHNDDGMELKLNAADQARKERKKEAMARSLEQAVQRRSTSFASLASAIQAGSRLTTAAVAIAAASTNDNNIAPIAPSRFAMRIGQSGGSGPDSDDAAAGTFERNQLPPVDLTIPPLERPRPGPGPGPPSAKDKRKDSEAAAGSHLAHIHSVDGNVDDDGESDCLILSSRTPHASHKASSPSIPASVLPRVRSWIDLFEVFEHYPHVPIAGFRVPEPVPDEPIIFNQAQAQTQTNDTTGRRQRSRPDRGRKREVGKSARKLPRFLVAPTMFGSDMDYMEHSEQKVQPASLSLSPSFQPLSFTPSSTTANPYPSQQVGPSGSGSVSVSQSLPSSSSPPPATRNNEHDRECDSKPSKRIKLQVPPQNMESAHVHVHVHPSHSDAHSSMTSNPVSSALSSTPSCSRQVMKGEDAAQSQPIPRCTINIIPASQPTSSNDAAARLEQQQRDQCHKSSQLSQAESIPKKRKLRVKRTPLSLPSYMQPCNSAAPTLFAPPPLIPTRRRGSASAGPPIDLSELPH